MHALPRSLPALLVGVLGGVLLGSGCAPSAPRPAAATDDAPRLDLLQLERDVQERANAERIAQGLRTLAWSDSIATVARHHSEDMARRDFFDHRNPDGLDPSQRARVVGLRCEIVEGSSVWRGFAENLFYTQRFSTATTTTFGGGRTETTYHWKSAGDLAAESIRQWMNSPGHRANLLQPRSRRAGVGIALGTDRRIYFTHVFC